MLLTGTFIFADFVGLACVVAVFVFVFWFLNAPNKSSGSPTAKRPSRALSTYQPPTREELAAAGVGGNCRVCNKCTGINASWDYASKRELICPACEQIYKDNLEEGIYPEEISKLLEEHPEYENELAPKEIMGLLEWGDYHELKKKLHDGDIDKDTYTQKRNQLIRQHRNRIMILYSHKQDLKEKARRSQYDPSQDSKF